RFTGIRATTTAAATATAALTFRLNLLPGSVGVGCNRVCDWWLLKFGVGPEGRVWDRGGSRCGDGSRRGGRFSTLIIGIDIDEHGCFNRLYDTYASLRQAAGVFFAAP